MVVYKITNSLNGKIYVGQTRQKIEKRFLQHSTANSPLGQAMRQCGIENFTIEIIEECRTQEELNRREQFWIKVLNSKVPNGYNLSNGINVETKLTSEYNAIKLKTFSVKQAAEMLGVSEFTIRRRIQDGVLPARLGSKRQGYQITKDDLISYAKSINDKIGSFWTDAVFYRL